MRRSREARVAELSPLTELADEINKKRVTLWRWSAEGLSLRDGTRLRLRTGRAGVLLTSRS